MKERPIIFNTAMVQAILNGSKSQTRRVIKLQPPQYCDAVEQLDTGTWNFYKASDPDFHAYLKRKLSYPYGRVGDRLWVKETIYKRQDIDEKENPQKAAHYVLYKADNPDLAMAWHSYDKATPSIFMPRWASRITLGITGIRVERVQEISEADAKAEGVNEISLIDRGGYYSSFADLWDSINGKKYPWESNPWVWVISFRQETL